MCTFSTFSTLCTFCRMVRQIKPNMVLLLLVFLCLYFFRSGPILWPETSPASIICIFYFLLVNYLTCLNTTRPICWKPCPSFLVLHLFSHCCSFRLSFGSCRSFSSPEQSLQSSLRIPMEIFLSFSRSISMNAVLSKHRIVKCLGIWSVNPHTNFWEKGMNLHCLFQLQTFQMKALIYKLLL